MNILLVNPPIPNKFRMFDYADEDGKKAILRRILVGPPLGLNDIAGMLTDENVVILDQKTELDQNKDYDFIQAITSEIDNFQPDIIGITCLAAQYNSVIKLLDMIKKINSKVLLIVGGIHPTLCPNDFGGSGADILCIGLGKLSFFQVVQEYKSNGESADYKNIYGLALKSGNGFTFTRPQSEIGYSEFKKNFLLDNVLPDRSLTEKYNYIFPPLNKKIQYISTSQGCTHKCNFCTIWPMTCGRYFYRDVDSIINELKQMEQYPVIRFCDANTFGDIEKAKQLFTKIIENGLNKHIYFADLRTDTVVKHPEAIELAVKAGLKVTVCGIEATTDEELIKYGKENSVETTKEAFKILNEAGVMVNGNYIIRPDYAEKDFENVGRFIEENPIYHAGLTILTPFPGTEQWEELKDQVVIKDLDYYNLTNAVLKTRLQEKDFYHHVSEIFKISGKATQKFMSKYRNVVPVR